jgi:hypothetical protein
MTGWTQVSICLTHHCLDQTRSGVISGVKSIFISSGKKQWSERLVNLVIGVTRISENVVSKNVTSAGIGEAKVKESLLFYIILHRFITSKATTCRLQSRNIEWSDDLQRCVREKHCHKRGVTIAFYSYGHGAVIHPGPPTHPQLPIPWPHALPFYKSHILNSCFPKNFHFSFIFSHGHHVIINLDHLCAILWKKRIKTCEFPKNKVIFKLYLSFEPPKNVVIIES